MSGLRDTKHLWIRDAREFAFATIIANMRVELERGVNYNAKVAHFAHSVNRLVINNVINVAGVDIT